MHHCARYPAIVILAVAAICPRIFAADALADIDAQYQAALDILKRPPIAGILITEVGPESAAATAGLRGGDIITDYDGTRITTLQQLSQQVADAIAVRLDQAANGKPAQSRVLIRVRRGNDDKLFQTARDPLGVRAVEVQANVAGPRNPPPSLRGSIPLNWRAALDADGTNPLYLRTLEQTPAAGGTAEENWIGWQNSTLASFTDDSLTATVEWFRLDESAPQEKPGRPPNTQRAAITFKLTLGDYKTSPPFLLASLDAQYPGPADTHVSAAATRIGDRLQRTITIPPASAPANAAAKAPDTNETTIPLNSLPQAALPWVAAALPHQSDATLSLFLISPRDLLPRPGYVLTTRAQQSLPDFSDPAFKPPAKAWRVDLLHVGVIVESYWFSDQSRLLAILTQAPSPIVSRRVPMLNDASLPALPAH